VIGVGIIGAGWWAGEHAKAVAATPGARLVAFASRAPARIASFQRDYGAEGYDDYRRLLDRSDVDAVAIAVPHDVHAAIAIEALRAGKHVLLEKPMARDRQECARIAAAARQSAKSFMLGLTHHFIPPIAAAKAIVARGDLGEVVSGFCASTHPWGWERRPRFYLDRALGGGVWLTLGVHFVDRLLWLIDSDVVAVKGVLGRRFHRPEELPADDAATALLHFANGATGTIVLAGYRAGPVWDELQLVAERGGLRLDERGLAVGRDGDWQTVEVAADDPMRLEWLAFARAIDEGTPPPVSLEHALRVMDVVFAVEESAATGRELVIERG
jgi:phthalate 4,5-cis-dihydrodiol dehydrogenase